MLSMNDLTVGSVFKYNQAPHTVVKADHVKMGRGGAILRSKIKNLITGQVLEVTFKGSDKIEEADLERRKATYLYQEDDNYYFMDTQQYEQFVISGESIGENKSFLAEDSDMDVLYFENKPVVVQLPKVVELEITETAPGVRGDTAQGSVTKPATLSTGATINVPLFVKQGDVVKVNTETQQYIERV